MEHKITGRKVAAFIRSLDEGNARPNKPVALDGKDRAGGNGGLTRRGSPYSYLLLLGTLRLFEDPLRAIGNSLPQ